MYGKHGTRNGTSSFPDVWLLPISPPKKIPGWFCRISEALVTDSDPMDVLEAGFPVPWKRWLWFSRTSPKKSPDSACFAARSCFTTPSQRAFKTGRDQWQGRSQRNAMYRSCKICKMPVLSSLQPVNPSYLYKLNIYNYIYIYITICIYIYGLYSTPIGIHLWIIIARVVKVDRQLSFFFVLEERQLKEPVAVRLYEIDEARRNQHFKGRLEKTRGFYKENLMKFMWYIYIYI